MAQIKLTTDGTKYLTFLHQLDNFSSKVAELYCEGYGDGQACDEKRAEVFNAFNTARDFLKGQVLADLADQMEYEGGIVLEG